MTAACGVERTDNYVTSAVTYLTGPLHVFVRPEPALLPALFFCLLCRKYLSPTKVISPKGGGEEKKSRSPNSDRFARAHFLIPFKGGGGGGVYSYSADTIEGP